MKGVGQHVDGRNLGAGCRAGWPVPVVGEVYALDDAAVVQRQVIREHT